jgi:hypothetical protein
LAEEIKRMVILYVIGDEREEYLVIRDMKESFALCGARVLSSGPLNNGG